MRQIINLYLAGEKVEFNQPPEIHYCYTENDMTNPTVIKNSYSKTLTIEGTPRNNAIFGHFWDLERVQTYGVGSYSGVEFNALKKADFTLYLNGEIYESGYFKLDEVRKTGNYIEYDITLYGGLGQFFYNLTYAAGDESAADGPYKMELCDLFTQADNLDFVIDRNTVNEAWGAVGTEDEGNRWKTLNFAPCYNGIPDDGFDADKILMEERGLRIPLNTTQNGYYLGTFNGGLTEWETMDLRSYLQRPVLRVKSVIEKICMPVNNGGYNVALDEHFFNDSNPYWKDAWVTLPMLTQLGLSHTESEEIEDATLTRVNTSFYRIDADGISGFGNTSMGLQIAFNPSTATDGRIYTTHYYRAHGGATLQNFVKEYSYCSSIDVQFVGMKNDKVVQISPVYHLVSGFIPHSQNDPSFNNLGRRFSLSTDYIPDVPVDNSVTMWGFFDKIDGQYVWCDLDGNPVTIESNMGSLETLDDIYVKIKSPYTYERKDISGGFKGPLKANNSNPYFYTTQEISSNRWESESTVMARDRVSGTLGVSISYIYSEVEYYTGKKSGLKIPYRKLLKLGVTPCDFLLSYTKMFGLYFFKEPDSDTIHIMDRNTFYKREDVVNLESIIDRSKPMKIAPQLPTSKWYMYKHEPLDTEANNKYFEAYGQEYGSQRINTQYNFNAEVTDLLDGQIFKDSPMVLEKDKYFMQRTLGAPVCCFNNMQYNTFDSTGNKNGEYVFYGQVNPVIFSKNLNLYYYDAFPKLQLHKEGNESADGSMVLLFYSGKKNLIDCIDEPVEYTISDDTDTMMELNDGTPCWMLTEDTGKVIRISQLPFFTRDLYSATDMVTHTWDFGVPMENYVPFTGMTKDSTVYSRCWKDYITDIYSVNTRKLDCYCLLRERPNPNWLRRFYWFDNCIWRLNKISDWNVSSYDTTEMEFIKVQDRNNYKVEQISSDPIFYITLDSYTIDYLGGTITGTVYCQDGDAWYMESRDSRYCQPQSSSGGVSTPITISIPRNDNGYTYDFAVTIDGEKYSHVYVTQTPKPIVPLVLSPDHLTIDWYTTEYDGFNKISVTANNNWTANYRENE